MDNGQAYEKDEKIVAAILYSSYYNKFDEIVENLDRSFVERLLNFASCNSNELAVAIDWFEASELPTSAMQLPDLPWSEAEYHVLMTRLRSLLEEIPPA